MLEFNNNHIFTGYLKQLLSTFNLPTYRIYTKENVRYKQKYGVESPEILETIHTTSKIYKDHTRYIPYIKNGNIEEYVYHEDIKDGKDNSKYIWEKVDVYYSANPRVNYTRNLRINNNIYDTYTHEYLGDYLRFLRDYYNLDLMSLYNCFSNKICQNLDITCYHTILTEDNKIDRVKHFSFDTKNSNFKIYMLPVKFFKEYTIAIDCDAGIEVCCGIYGKYQDTNLDSYNDFSHSTYKKYRQTMFNQPVLYSPLKDIRTFLTKDSVVELANREKDLKLFIKVPIQCNSSIVVLEGNYLNYNDGFACPNEPIRDEYTYDKNGKEIQNKEPYWYSFKNHTVTNFESQERLGNIVSNLEYSVNRDFKPISTLQLLMLNTGTSYPFADRLIEYLTNNAITQLDDVNDNIMRVQEVVSKATGGFKIKENPGIWDNRLQPILYEFMQNENIDREVNHDILGYVDKDVEQLYNDKNEPNPVSIANVDIYPDIYKNNK